MPYYDEDGRQLSGRHDTSARGPWIYTEDGTRLAKSTGPQYDEASAALWALKILLFTLPLKAIQLVLWSAGVGWRSGGKTYRTCANTLGQRGVRPWLGASIAGLAATVAFATITVGLVAYVVTGIVAAVSMDTALLNLWVTPLIVLVVGRLLWKLWRAIRTP